MNDILPPPAPTPTPGPAQPTPVPTPTPPAAAKVQPTPVAPSALPPPQMPVVPKEHKLSKLRQILSYVAVLAIAPLLALTITAYIFQSYEVDGPSMQSTLQNNDRLIIWKVARTWARITRHDYVPKRGDVVVFIKRGLYEDNGTKEKQLIKRVIALPGERITVKDGKMTVFNTAHPDGFSPDATLPYGKVIHTTEGSLDVTVPAGKVFVTGDNRGNSLDSRYFGPIPNKDIIGKLVARILPLGNAEKF